MSATTTISAKMVGELRERTGGGLMDCKKALVESEGDFEAAVAWLRKKGMATADKKSGRNASEGVIETYIHLGGKVGVMVELACETDFVAKNDEFKAFARDIAMHIAASSPICVSRDQVPAEEIEKERKVAEGQAEGKPAQAVQKIVEGKIEKYLSQVCLMEQAFVKDQEKTVDQILKEFIAKMGENMVVKRFAHFKIGA